MDTSGRNPRTLLAIVVGSFRHDTPSASRIGWDRTSSTKRTLPTLQCPECVTGPVATIEMTIAGQRVALHVCSRCDARRWRTRWGVVPLTEVLSMI
jgi:hypothetical protein